jgi:hypothetical protein
MGKKKVDERVARVKKWLSLQKHEALRESRPCRLRVLVLLGDQLVLLQRWLNRKTQDVHSALLKAQALEHAEREARWGYTANEEAFQAREQQKLDEDDACCVSAPTVQQKPLAKLREADAQEEAKPLELIEPTTQKTTPEELLSSLGDKNSPVVHLLTGKAKGRYDALGRLAKQAEWRVTQLPLEKAQRTLHLLSNSFRNRELGKSGRHLVLVDAREAAPEELRALVRPAGLVDPLDLLRVAILLGPGTSVPKELAAMPAVSF